MCLFSFSQDCSLLSGSLAPEALLIGVHFRKRYIDTIQYNSYAITFSVLKWTSLIQWCAEVLRFFNVRGFCGVSRVMYNTLTRRAKVNAIDCRFRQILVLTCLS